MAVRNRNRPFAGRPWWMAVCTAAAGCVAGAPAEPQPFAACFAPQVGATATGTSMQGRAASFSGAVAEAGVGDPPADCFDATVGLQSTPELDRDAAWWFEAADAAGDVWVVGVWVPDGPEGPAVGDSVSVDLSYLPGQFGPTVGWVDVRDAAGAPIAWVGVAGELASLPDPPGVTLAQGDAVASDGDTCGQWSSYELLANGEVIPYGGTGTLATDVGTVEVRHGGLELAVQSDGCPDWFVAHAAVAVVPAGAGR